MGLDHVINRRESVRVLGLGFKRVSCSPPCASAFSLGDGPSQAAGPRGMRSTWSRPRPKWPLRAGLPAEPSLDQTTERLSLYIREIVVTQHQLTATRPHPKLPLPQAACTSATTIVQKCSTCTSALRTSLPLPHVQGGDPAPTIPSECQSSGIFETNLLLLQFFSGGGGGGGGGAPGSVFFEESGIF